MERRTARFTDLVGQIDYVWFGQIALTKCCCILSKKVKMCIAHKNVKLCIGRKKEMRISAAVTSCTSSFNSRWKLCHKIWKLLKSYHFKSTLKDFNCRSKASNQLLSLNYVVMERNQKIFPAQTYIKYQ